MECCEGVVDPLFLLTIIVGKYPLFYVLKTCWSLLKDQKVLKFIRDLGDHLKLIYINKVAVWVFVCLSETFSFTIVTITQVLVQTFATRRKTTN